MRRLGLPVAVVLALSITLTWPQVLHLSTHVGSHFDPYFSMWRLNWVAHALRTAPLQLFNGNMFHPTPNTLALSDAMMLEGIIGAPALWAGVSPVLVYNLLLLAGIAGSGIGMFVLARRLTGETGPALVSAAVFTMVPYRIEHFIHLELQWAMWVPLTLWTLHRTVDEGAWRMGMLAGLFVWLQILSCVYYGVFLTMTLGLFVPLLLFLSGRTRAVRAAPALAAGAILAAVLTAPYAIPYLETARAIGPRPLSEVANYSAEPLSYLIAAERNWLWGWTRELSRPELILFPGSIAIVLTVAAAWHPVRRLLLLYAAVTALAIELSLGMNGIIYPWLLERVPSLQGLRALVRFGIIALCGIAMLAGFGVQAIRQRLALRSARLYRAAVPLLLALMVVDYAPSEMSLTEVAQDPPEERSVYAALRGMEPGVVLDLPMPPLHELPGYDPWYSYWSRGHWNPLVNGYSGYYPPGYMQTLVEVAAFPDDTAIARLRQLDVRYVIVHQTHYAPTAFVTLLLKLGTHPRFGHMGTFRAPSGQVELFVFRDAS